MTYNKTPDLLPCPFCGGRAELKYHNHTSDYYAVCKNWACGSKSNGDREFATNAWNKRVDKPTPDVEAALDALDEIQRSAEIGVGDYKNYEIVKQALQSKRKAVDVEHHINLLVSKNCKGHAKFIDNELTGLLKFIDHLKEQGVL